MMVAIGGAVVVVQADDAAAGAKNALLGDVLVLLGTSTCAAVYMVYFRIKFPDMLPADLLGFFIAKNVVFMIIFLPGFWILDAIGFELFRWPDAGEWGMIWVVGACSVVFNITLNWSTLKISPLHARLSILVGLPISFVFDAVTGTFSSLRLLGVSLVVAGLVLYFAFETKVDESESGAEAETEALQSKKPQRKAVDVV
jgi:drug/metabolite transporter (DMT)-like permease